MFILSIKTGFQAKFQSQLALTALGVWLEHFYSASLSEWLLKLQYEPIINTNNK